MTLERVTQVKIFFAPFSPNTLLLNFPSIAPVCFYSLRNITATLIFCKHNRVTTSYLSVPSFLVQILQQKRTKGFVWVQLLWLTNIYRLPLPYNDIFNRFLNNFIQNIIFYCLHSNFNLILLRRPSCRSCERAPFVKFNDQRWYDSEEPQQNWNWSRQLRASNEC